MTLKLNQQLVFGPAIMPMTPKLNQQVVFGLVFTPMTMKPQQLEYQQTSPTAPMILKNIFGPALMKMKLRNPQLGFGH